MKIDYFQQEKESPLDFDARMAQEDEEAKQVCCPLESCGAEVGERCCDGSGVGRIRHSKRLVLARGRSET